MTPVETVTYGTRSVVISDEPDALALAFQIRQRFQPVAIDPVSVSRRRSARRYRTNAFVVYKDGVQPSGALALEWGGGSALLGIPTIRLAGHGVYDTQVVAAGDADSVAALAYALRWWLAQRRAWRLQFEQLLAQDDSLSPVYDAVPNAQWSQGDPVPILEWQEGAHSRNWARKKARANERRAQAQLQRTATAWHVVCLTDPGEISRLLPTLADLRARRELALNRPDVFADPHLRRGHEELIVQLAHAGKAEVWTLTIAGTLAGYAVAGRVDGTQYLLDSRIDPASAAHEPGTLLFAQMLRTWHAQPAISRVDFGRGASTFKRRWQTTQEERYTLVGWSSLWVRRIEEHWTLVTGRARRVLRQARDRSSLAYSGVRVARQIQARCQRSRGPRVGVS